VSVLSTVLIYVLIPAACVGAIVALSRAGGHNDRPSRRYRPGRPYDFAPIWFLAAPEQVSSTFGGRTLEQRAQAPAIESGVIEDSAGRPVRAGSVGGASDRW
jgi:hypothetical protein